MNRHDELHHEHRVKFALIEQSKVQTNWWKDATGKALVTMIFMIVGAAVMLILQKTDIVDVSTVSASDYEQIDFITSSYGENNP